MGRGKLEGPPETCGALQSTGAAPTSQHLLAHSSTPCIGCHCLGRREHKHVDPRSKHSGHLGEVSATQTLIEETSM